MSYATIMVHLDLNRGNDAPVHVACELADLFGAGLVGITACQPEPVAYAEGAVAQSLVAKLRTEAEEKIAVIQERFQSATQGRGKGSQFRSGFGVPAEFIAREARAADLLVTGSEIGAFPDPLWRVDPSELVMQLGRPILVVPAEVTRLRLGHVVVAWKDTREARRAVADALPLLHKAKEVTVMEIAESDDDRSAATRRVSDVVGWLAEHGVTASNKVPTRRGNAVEQLAEQAGEIGADLIVAGAYGHTRLREWIFGGVTRDLIRQAHRCAFLSH